MLKDNSQLKLSLSPYQKIFEAIIPTNHLLRSKRFNVSILRFIAICFLALVLIRLLEQKLGNRFSAAQILRALGKYNCTHLDANNWQFTCYDEVLDACAVAFNYKA